MIFSLPLRGKVNLWSPYLKGEIMAIVTMELI
jgi:hypothetical protein